MPELMARLRNYQSNQKAFRPEIDRAAIIAARKDGMLFREIRDKFGVPHETARTICITGKTEQIDYELVKARALEFLILIGSPRGVEMRKTQWREIDEDHEILTIPRAPESLRAQGLTRTRMKVKKGDDFIIPLNRRAMDILNEMRPISDGDYVFPGSLKGRNQEIRERLADKTPRIAGVPMGRQEPLRFLRKKLGYNVDVHGFRSTFTDWAFATGRFREIAIELCLDHAYGNKVQRAYRRGQLVEERRELLEVWSNYCAGRSADIIRPRFGRKTTA
jgi:integrase